MTTGVSFVVPVYNKAPYLKDVLAQIKRQRGDFRRHYVFIDDGSTDSSLQQLNELTEMWENVEIVSQVNAGSAAATNRGIEMAREPYIKFVDADDLISTDATACLLRALEDSDAALAYGNVARYRDRSELDLDHPIGEAPVHLMKRPLREAMFNSLFNPTQCLVRTAAVQATGGCDERVVFSQEYSMTMRLARVHDFIKVDAPIAFLPDEVEGRLSNNQGRQLQRVTRTLMFFLQDHPDIPDALKQQICKRAAFRGWKYAKRVGGESWLTSPAFWRQMRSLLPIRHGHVEFIEKCCSVYERAAESAHLKRPDRKEG